MDLQEQVQDKAENHLTEQQQMLEEVILEKEQERQAIKVTIVFIQLEDRVILG